MPTRQRLPYGQLAPLILAHLATYPHLPFTPWELAKVLGHSHGTIRRTLLRLAAAGTLAQTSKRPARFQHTQQPIPHARRDHTGDTRKGHNVSTRYEVGDNDTDIAVIGPHDEGSLWDDEFTSEGRHALLIGNPWATAYAVIGTPDQLRAFVGRAADMVKDL